MRNSLEKMLATTNHYGYNDDEDRTMNWIDVDFGHTNSSHRTHKISVFIEQSFVDLFRSSEKERVQGAQRVVLYTVSISKVCKTKRLKNDSHNNLKSIKIRLYRLPILIWLNYHWRSQFKFKHKCIAFSFPESNCSLCWWNELIIAWLSAICFLYFLHMPYACGTWILFHFDYRRIDWAKTTLQRKSSFSTLCLLRRKYLHRTLYRKMQWKTRM